MTVNPYAPPTAEVADPVEPPVPRPRRIIVAMLLLCMSAALAVTLSLIQHRGPFVGQIVFRIGLIAGFCVAIATRRNWGRWVFSAFVAFTWYALSEHLVYLVRPPFTLDRVWTLAVEVPELLALILLFTGPASRWFKQPRSVVR